MSIACKVILNGQTLYPALPIERTAIIVGQTLDLLNGNSRFYFRKARYQWALTIPDVDETTRNTWAAAAGASTTVTYVDETSTSYTCRVTDVGRALTRTTPAIDEGADTTGPGYYDLSITIEQVQ